jgi:2-polyprenyl-3-methyl-5-hydroxy-6-metoxy-1,4-benzoquinol methylase
MGIITRNACPVCNSATISNQLRAEDYTVSHQQFEIWECANCSLRFTQNVPDLLAVTDFYQSDNYISHTDTDKGIINKLYHLVRKTTLKRKLHLIEQTTGIQKGTLLDIGAGSGAFAHTMQQAGWGVTGLEPDAATRQRAAALYNLELQDTGALFQLPAPGFDAITLWHVLEHVHELHAYIEQIKLLLKEKGRALIAVPNYTSYDAQTYRQYWAAYDVPRHLYHFSPAAVKNLLKQHGLQLLAIKPMWFDSFYISMLSEQYKNGKNNFIKAVWTGMLSNLTALFNKERCSSVIYVIGKQGATMSDV